MRLSTRTSQRRASNDDGIAEYFQIGHISGFEAEDEVTRYSETGENRFCWETIPGISQLRCLDADIVSRPYWMTHVGQESENKEEDIDDEEQRSNVWFRACHLRWPNCLIRFGSSSERTIWFMMRVLALLDLLFSSFIASFDVVYPLRRTTFIFFLDFPLTALFACGIALNLSSTYIGRNDCAERTDFAHIKRARLSSWSTRADVVAFCAAPLLHVVPPLGYLWVLRLLKCWRLPRNGRRTTLLAHLGQNEIGEVFSITIGIFVATHLFACIWFQAKINSALGYGHEWSSWNGWSVDVFDVSNADRGALSLPIEMGTLDDLYWCYARSFRDGAYMLISWAGPNAMSRCELITIGALAPLSGLIMAYVYATFVESAENARILERRYLSHMKTLSMACDHMVLPMDLQRRICSYYSFLSNHHLGNEVQEVFAQLSPNLTSEIRMFRMHKVIREASFFGEFSARVLLLLVQNVVEQAFSPGDMVFGKGEAADCMYILIHGVASVLIDDAATVLVRYLHVNDVFGEVCFLHEQMTRTAWIRAETYLVLWRFDKDKFDEYSSTDKEVQQQMVRAILKRVGSYDPKTIAPHLRVAAEEFLHQDDDKDQEHDKDTGDGEACLEPEDHERTPLMSAERSPATSRPGSARSTGSKSDSMTMMRSMSVPVASSGTRLSISTPVAVAPSGGSLPFRRKTTPDHALISRRMSCPTIPPAHGSLLMAHSMSDAFNGPLRQKLTQFSRQSSDKETNSRCRVSQECEQSLKTVQAQLSDLVEQVQSLHKAMDAQRQSLDSQQLSLQMLVDQQERLTQKVEVLTSSCKQASPRVVCMEGVYTPFTSNDGNIALDGASE